MSELPLGAIERRDPFVGPRLIERAVVVITFAPIAKIGDEKNKIVSAFQEAIRHDYPRFAQRIEQSVKIEIDEKGQVASAPSGERSWIFQSEDERKKVVLTTELLALEIQKEAYTNWKDYTEALLKLIDAFEKYAEPSHLARLGVRYLNTGPVGGDGDPRQLCNRALTTITGKSPLEAADLLWMFRVDEGTLLLRSGIMPANATYDAFFRAREGRTWYLDIDVASQNFEPFNREVIAAKLQAQAERLHAIYAWAMTKDDER
ncbi:TIGR04255 family protein [Qipengyuania sp.]|uniref:TIGR04255 family protein n=1 Tax=Qipengyuania sp. TaxID=2004515 RepID=UPI0035112BC3